jgi:hypothetical protein
MWSSLTWLFEWDSGRHIHLNFKNIKHEDFAVFDWSYAAYCKVRDQEDGGSIFWGKPVNEETYNTTANSLSTF